jgi:hypothetical protein
MKNVKNPKKLEEFSQFLFRVKNNEDGMAFIKEARKHLQDGCRLIILGNGPRAASRKKEIENGRTDVVWSTYQNYLPLKYATELRVYLVIHAPANQEMDCWTRPGDFRIYGPYSILKSARRRKCMRCNTNV